MADSLQQLNQRVDHLIEQLITPTNPAVQGWLVAYSGGLDSTVLLLLAAKARERAAARARSLPLAAVHVNHQVNPLADSWEAECVRVAQSLAIPIYALRLVPLHGAQNLEARLRQLRYQQIASRLPPNWCLLLAHHANDQAETLLLQLLRGSGVRGLAAMASSIEPWQHGFRWRPLLAFTKRELQTWLTHTDPTRRWIEDDSNQQLCCRRNLLRHTIIPRLSQIEPAAVHNLTRSAGLMADNLELLIQLAQEDWQGTQAVSQTLAPAPEKTPASNQLRPGPIIYWPTLARLPLPRQHNLWRYIFHALGYQMPSLAQLRRIQAEVITAKPDAQPLLRLAEVTVRRYRERIYLLPHNTVFDSRLCYPCSDQNAMRIGQVDFPDGRRCLVFTTIVDADTSMLNWQVLQRNDQLTLQSNNNALNNKTMTRHWMKWAQNLGVPPWWRNALPLLFYRQELVLVPGFWAAPGWQWRWQDR